MNLVETEFHPAFPAALKPQVEADLRWILPMLATEITRIIVTPMDEGGVEGGAWACVQTRRHYHVATLWLGSEWYGMPETRRRIILRHEAAHVLLDDLTREMARALNFHVEDETARKHLSEILEEAEDRVCDALALAWETCELPTRPTHIPHPMDEEED